MISSDVDEVVKVWALGMIDNEGTEDVPAGRVMPLRLIDTDEEGDHQCNTVR